MPYCKLRTPVGCGPTMMLVREVLLLFDRLHIPHLPPSGQAVSLHL